MDGPEEEPLRWYIGHDETDRQTFVSEQLFIQAQDCGYDMLTTPITTDHFRKGVFKRSEDYVKDYSENKDIRPEDAPTPIIPALTQDDTDLTPDNHISHLLLTTSPWIDLASPDPLIANLSQQVLHLEIAYAAFCGASTVIIHGPRLHHGDYSNTGATQYARAILEALSTGPYLQLQVLLPMTDDLELTEKEKEFREKQLPTRDNYLQGDGSASKSDELGTWDAWHIIRSVCRYNTRLTVALTVPRALPPASVIHRWYSEPVRLLHIPFKTWVQNSKGWPVLSKPVQMLLAHFMRLRVAPWILLSDIGEIPGMDDDGMIMEATPLIAPSALNTPTSSARSLPLLPTPSEAAQLENLPKWRQDRLAGLKYIRWLQNSQPPQLGVERFAAGYQDYLQNPLQPLADNLESITYEVFEKDPIKYEWYERAVTAALSDWTKLEKVGSGPGGVIVVAVVGAGRGPLMFRALEASRKTGIRIDAYAVEKNPNAYVHLQRRNKEEWHGKVKVIKSDMRAWNGPQDGELSYGVDILISELLGSFGDNELSPECLDGVQDKLSKGGISIPSSYTAHLTPIATPKLYADVQARHPTDPNAFDTPYVVMFSQLDYLSTVPVEDRSKAPVKNYVEDRHPDVRQTWEFKHRLPSSIITQSLLRKGGSADGGGGGIGGGDGFNEHNSRFWRGTFKVPQRGACHGLAGYFETVLYKSPDEAKVHYSEKKGACVELSTNPLTMDAKSKDMISWFPIFFPLKTPLYLPGDSEVDVSMWRVTDDRKVWYEWLVESWMMVGEKRVRLGVSEMGSSKKGGCLM